MPRRVNPIMLLGLVIALILSFGLFAGAQSGGGAVGTALGQVGKPYAFGSDGPGTFSCTGLVRFALRSVGIMDAPWDHHAYLSAYPTVASPEPGDVVVYPDGAAMYVGDGTVVMANHADGQVGTYPMGSIGTPVGFARPTGGGGTGTGGTDPAAVDPVVDPAMADGQMADGQRGMDPTIPVDQTAVDPAAVPVDPAMADGQRGMDPTIPVDQTAVPIDPAAVPIDPAAVPIDPAAVPIDPAAVPIDPAAVPV
jgi:NlpC/P60 family